MRVLLAGILLAGVGLSALPGQGEGDIGAVLRVRRIVKVRDPGGDRSLRAGDPVRLGQTIRTGVDSGIEMSFDGDGRLLLWPSTRVELLPPGPPGERHPGCQGQVAARIELRHGDLQVDHDPAKRALVPKVLEIVTDDARICLFGTSIQVHLDPDDGAGTGVFVQETGAWVHSIKAGGWLKLEADMQTFVRGAERLRSTRVSRLTLPEPAGEGRFLDSPLFDPIVF